jgi:bifunctional non-homologous end joining protein LigD
VPFRASPMLATLADDPFDRSGWIFEEKYDGVRMLAYKEGSNVSLFSRNEINRTLRYPEIAEAISKLKGTSLCLDGEIVVFDAKKISRFQLLQRGKGRPQYAAFDCLYANGEDLRCKPLSERRAALERFLKPGGVLLLSSRLPGNGIRAFQTASRRGFEGVVAKNLDSKYSEGRSAEWQKVKVHKQDEFVIGGFTEPTGSRNHFGALLLGVYSEGEFVYAGKVGTGFDGKSLGTLYAKFKPLIRFKSPFQADAPERNVTFLKPHLVAQISYSEWTNDGKLRHPVFLGLRDDKTPKEVRRDA